MRKEDRDGERELLDAAGYAETYRRRKLVPFTEIIYGFTYSLNIYKVGRLLTNLRLQSDFAQDPLPFPHPNSLGRALLFEYEVQILICILLDQRSPQ